LRENVDAATKNILIFISTLYFLPLTGGGGGVISGSCGVLSSKMPKHVVKNSTINLLFYLEKLVQNYYMENISNFLQHQN
jgi:hypothetical protein